MFAVGAVVWGVAISSQVILFDGVYSFVSVLLSLGSLLAAGFIRKTDDLRFPFGKETIEPLVITFKYLAIGAMCLFALFSAVSDLFEGGRAVNLGSATLYGAVATAACLLVYLYFKRRGGGAGSGFVRAEANQWLMDGLLSAGVLAGFVLALVLSLTPLAAVTAYVDPLMLILVSAYFLKVPVGEIRKAGREVLEMSPEEDLRRRLEEIVHGVEEEYGFDEPFIRLSKVGSKLYIEVDYVVGDESRVRDVTGFDQVRQLLSDRLEEVELSKWLTISFTADRKWAL
ncbi:MAG: cation diffusion facilitator family transporter [Rubrobacter sp.]|nr:cation diffusion facilitator family transporter [Rubrobacter sp.]